jgi:hypothetical protein
VKSLLLMLLGIAGVIALMSAVLVVAHFHINPIEPISAAFIGMASAAIALIPILRGQHRDMVGVLQLAMIGTVLHLVTQVALATGMFLTHTVTPRGPFLMWLLAEYWISLICLVWQLRRILLSITPVAKAGK